MKKRISAFVCLLIIMGILPLLVVKMSANDKNGAAASATADIADNSSEKICAYALNLCGNGFCDEAVKAAVIAANTNYIASKTEFDNINVNFNSDKELCDKIKNTYNSVRELYLAYNGKAVYIPHSICSCGNTVKSDKYGYIKPVASPWDCFDKEYDQNAACEGLSMCGVNYLCQNGFTAKQALKWYLPDFKIKKL